jgi:hypothetical protein
MSCLYWLQLELSFDRNTPFSHSYAAIHAAQELWPFRDCRTVVDGAKRLVLLSGVGQLSGDAEVTAFADDLCKAIWSAAGYFVGMRLEARCLDDIPAIEVHFNDETAYAAFRQAAERGESEELV